MPENTSGKGPRRLAEAAPHCLVQALRRRSHVLQPGRSCSRLPLPKQLHLPNCEACMLKAPEPVYVHTQLLRTLCMTAILHRMLIHISIFPRKKKTSCHTLSQGFKESRIQSLRDSRTQAFKDSRIQAFKDSRAHGWKDSMIHVWAFVPRQPHQTFPNSSFGSPQSKAYEDTCSKALERKHKSGQI